MAVWGDIFVKQATATPDWTTAATVNFSGSAAEGNKVLLFVTASANATATTSDLTNSGWVLDQTFTSSQPTYVFSRSAPVGGLSGVTVNFSISNKPVLRLVEFTGVSLKHVTATSAGSAATGTVTTTVNDAVVIGVVQAVINGGEPTYDTWTNSFTSLGTLRSFASTPYALPNRVTVGMSYSVTTTAGSYSSAATMAGTGSPAVVSPGGFAISYQIGAVVPVLGAGADVAIGLTDTFARTATESNGGAPITARSWRIQSGPFGVNSTLSTTDTISWTPNVAGTYVLRYSASNSAGSSFDDVQVMVVAPIVLTGSSSPITSATLQTGLWRSRIRAEGPGGVSAFSAWSTPFSVTDGTLAFQHIPWEGGPNYWSQFSKANAVGWTDPNFFPISVFLSSAAPNHVASFKDANINLYMGVEHSPGVFPLTNITSQGLYAMPSVQEWTPAEVGNNNMAVAWFITDELEMGMNSQYQNPTEAQLLQEQTAWVNQARGYNDGRFVHANFGNGILRTFWAPNTMDDHVALMDSSSADKYTYTSPDVADIIDGVHDAPDWPNGTPVPRAYSYGWQADQMKRFQPVNDPRPIWTFIETAQPYLNEAGARAILPDEMEGAVWSALIHEARGVAYFQHNNDGRANYSIVDIPVVHDKVKSVNAKVLSLAAVLNTQSYYNTTVVVNGFTYYRFTFNNGTDTMLKTYNGHAYIFAGLGMGHTTGTKTFTVPAGINGMSVEVVGESRTLTVTGGQFSDSFPAEYTHHVYKIVL